jgi:hypothetical protein
MVDFVLEQVNEIKNVLLRDKASLGAAFTNAKTKLNINEYQRLTSQKGPIQKTLESFWGDVFPTNLDFGNVPFATNYTGDSLVEWKYLVGACISHKQQLGIFDKMRTDFERLMLKGDYESAEGKISEITSNFGDSFWIINARFLLAEKQGGTEANWAQLAEITKTKNEYLFRLLIELLSKKNESKIRYDEYIKSIIEQISVIPIDDVVKDFLLYSLSFKENIHGTSIGVIIYLYGALPVIDRYIFISKFSEYLFVNLGANDFRPFMYSLRQLHKELPLSFTVKNILLCEDQLPFDESMLDQGEFEYLDTYLDGDYESTRIILEKLFEENFRIKYLIDYYTILPNTSELKIIGEKGSIINELSRVIKAVVLKDSNFSAALKSANKLYAELDSFKEVSMLEFFIGREITFMDMVPYFTMLRVTGDEKISVSFLFNLKAGRELKVAGKVKESAHRFAHIATFLDQVDSYKGEAIDFGTFNNSFKRLTFAELMYSHDRLEDSISLYSEILDDSNQYVAAIAFLKIMEILIEEKMFRRALLHFERFLLSQPSFFYRVNMEFICNEIDANDFVNVDDLIITPIIFSRAQLPAHGIYSALDSFLAFHSVNKPTELIPIASSFNFEYLLILLKDVCTIDVIRYINVFENTAEVEGERIAILKYLSDFDFGSKKEVIEEIVEVTQRDVIRRGLRSYNSGKITMNFPQLRKYVTEKLSSSFSRFKEQKLFVEDTGFKSVDYETQVRVVLDLDNLGKINRYISLKDPSFISLKLIVNEIREIFLFSKEHGLDAHLSTRIRHGMLINHIKKIFANHHLLALKEESKFKSIEAWDYIKEEYPDRYSRLQQIFQRLSSKVDDYCNELRSEYIQIKTEKVSDKPKALFDFIFFPEFYNSLFAVIEEYNIGSNQFVDFFLGAFIKLTQNNFSRVQEHLKGPVTNELRNFLETAKIEVQELFNGLPVSGIFSEINKASTEITYELESISKWFQLAEEDSNFVLTASEIVSIAVKVSNILYPHYQINPIIESNSDKKLPYSIGIIDMLRNLIDNIVAHSSCNPDVVDIKISSSFNEKTDLLKICISNKLGEYVNIQSKMETLDDYKNNWHNKDFYGDRISNEGKSGLKKIRRLLEYDLEAPENHFDYFIDDLTLTICISFTILTPI